MRKAAGFLLKIAMLAVALLMLPALLDAGKEADVPLSPEMLHLIQLFHYYTYILLKHHTIYLG